MDGIGSHGPNHLWEVSLNQLEKSGDLILSLYS